MEAMKELMGYTKDDGTVVEPLKFNVVATKYSEDKAKEGGNLGWKRRDELNGAFAETAFKLAKGGVRAMIRSLRGLPPFRWAVRDPTSSGINKHYAHVSATLSPIRPWHARRR